MLCTTFTKAVIVLLGLHPRCGRVSPIASLPQSVVRDILEWFDGWTCYDTWLEPPHETVSMLYNRLCEPIALFEVDNSEVTWTTRDGGIQHIPHQNVRQCTRTEPGHRSTRIQTLVSTKTWKLRIYGHEYGRDNTDLRARVSELGPHGAIIWEVRYNRTPQKPATMRLDFATEQIIERAPERWTWPDLITTATYERKPYFQRHGFLLAATHTAFRVIYTRDGPPNDLRISVLELVRPRAQHVWLLDDA